MLGWCETEFLGTLTSSRLPVSVPKGWVYSFGGMIEKGKTEVLRETCPIAIVSTTGYT
jgi:hypothetical protein